jgi:hypothetical protein
MPKAWRHDEEELGGWHVTVSGPDHSETRFIEETLPRPAALRALDEVLAYLERAPGPGWVVACQHKTTGPKQEQTTLETWTFETNDQGELNEGSPRYHLPRGESRPTRRRGDESKLEYARIRQRHFLNRCNRKILSAPKPGFTCTLKRPHPGRHCEVTDPETGVKYFGDLEPPQASR